MSCSIASTAKVVLSRRRRPAFRAPQDVPGHKIHKALFETDRELFYNIEILKLAAKWMDELYDEAREPSAA